MAAAASPSWSSLPAILTLSFHGRREEKIAASDFGLLCVARTREWRESTGAKGTRWPWTQSSNGMRD
uniref:Uncharacterized protein n=1 Tax=Arundo donax TaxID=35708 RepID=A0A0A8YPR4_ARUDO